MLTALSIRNVVLIERLELEFAGGLSVLTGETGAGKSILLDALGLALGQRAESGLVGSWANSAIVTAEFNLSAGHAARAFIAEQGLDAEGPIVLRRQLNADGKSRAFVNDQPVGVGLLRQVGARLVEVEGQFEAHGLMDASTHRDLLDEFADLGKANQECALHHRDWREAVRQLKQAREHQELAERDADFLRHALSELERIDPKEGEEETLSRERALLSSREQISEALAEALTELSGDRGAERTLATAQRRLLRLSEKLGGDGTEALASLDRASIELSEATETLRGIERSLNADPNRLEKIEDRLFGLRDLARKHRVQVSELHALRDDFRSKVAGLDDGGQKIALLTAQTSEKRDRYVTSAQGLSDARAKAARSLERAVNRELGPLKLERARVSIRLDRLDEPTWNENGWDRVAIEVATNPGQPPGPIQRIASGGELARLMLALKLVLSKAQPVPTLVFDEVDAGIGGATAAAVGERLKRLSEGVQLLVITHSPQVAALGDIHWRCDKVLAQGTAKTTVSKLDQCQRREEIARMLSGANVTDEARAAASKLLVEAK